MTGRRIGLAAAVAVLGVTSVVMLTPTQARPDERPRGGAVGNVEVSMKEMGRAMRKLRGSVEDASKKAENLALIGEMQRGCVGAKGLPVPKDVLAQAADDAAKEKLGVEFRTRLIAVMRKLLDMEVSIMEGRNAEAKSALDELFAMQKEGHDVMGLSDDDEDKERGPKGGAPR
jgi:hypothetical protein